MPASTLSAVVPDFTEVLTNVHLHHVLFVRARLCCFLVPARAGRRPCMHVAARVVRSVFVCSTAIDLLVLPPRVTPASFFFLSRWESQPVRPLEAHFASCASSTYVRRNTANMIAMLMLDHPHSSTQACMLSPAPSPPISPTKPADAGEAGGRRGPVRAGMVRGGVETGHTAV